MYMYNIMGHNFTWAFLILKSALFLFGPVSSESNELFISAVKIHNVLVMYI